MIDLTEKWKLRELERGKLYWCKVKNKGVILCYLWLQANKFTRLAGYVNKCIFNEDILEVLAPCDYEELQALKAENAVFKDLIKECKEFFEEENPKYYTIMSERMDELLTKINEVLK